MYGKFYFEYKVIYQKFESDKNYIFLVKLYYQKQLKTTKIFYRLRPRKSIIFIRLKLFMAHFIRD